MTMQLNGQANGVAIERLVALGDLEGLQPLERAAYYRKVCESIGLNPLTQPFMYVKLNGKLMLYAKKDASDQLRKIHHVSVVIASREHVSDLCIVTARATTPDGRTDESIGAVNLAGLKGENLANALMKAETKAKRRVTLSICGLGWLDETEVQDVRTAKPVTVTPDGVIVEPSSEPDLTKQLSASIDWDAWVESHLNAIQGAPDPGSLNAAWADVNDEKKKLQPPPAAVDVLRKAKDAKKAELGVK